MPVSFFEKLNRREMRPLGFLGSLPEAVKPSDLPMLPALFGAGEDDMFFFFERNMAIGFFEGPKRSLGRKKRQEKKRFKKKKRLTLQTEPDLKTKNRRWLASRFFSLQRPKKNRSDFIFLVSPERQPGRGGGAALNSCAE